MKADATSILDELVSDVPDHIHLWRFIAGVAFALERYDDLASRWPKSDQSDEHCKQETTKVLTCVRVNTTGKLVARVFFRV